MLRKKVLNSHAAASSASTKEIDIAAHATVVVTSESRAHPIDHAFDASRGPGATRWVAEEPGEQTVTVVFDAPLTLNRVALEIEESQIPRRQELWLTVSGDGGRTFRELVRQEYNFAPPGTTFEREDWSIQEKDVTHLQVGIKPDKGDNPCRATLTALILG